jgi:hypothetical protein
VTRRRRTRDGLGAYVADSFLHADLTHALDQLPRYERKYIDFLLQQDDLTDRDLELLHRPLSWVRLNPALRDLLVVYLNDRIPTPAGRCLWCRKVLRPRDRGRPAQYCGPNHRQQAHRARRRAETERRGVDVASAPPQPQVQLPLCDYDYYGYGYGCRACGWARCRCWTEGPEWW